MDTNRKIEIHGPRPEYFVSKSKGALMAWECRILDNRGNMVPVLHAYVWKMGGLPLLQGTWGLN